MTKRDFLAMLRAERARFEKLLAAVGDSRMDGAGVSGVYAVKDILAHLEAYLRALVTWLAEAREGRIYVDAVLDQPDLEARNAFVYDASKDRSVSDVLEAFRRTWDDLEDSVSLLTDEELSDADATAWFVVPRWRRKQPLWQCIANDSVEHQEQHIPDIERWLAERGSVG